LDFELLYLKAHRDPAVIPSSLSTGQELQLSHKKLQREILARSSIQPTKALYLLAMIKYEKNNLKVI
jgi:hypothetical protein